MLHECVPCARAYMCIRVTSTQERQARVQYVRIQLRRGARGALRERERERGREGDRRWCESEEPATEKWGQGGPGCEGERKRDARDRRRRGGRREREGEGTVGGGRILAERWGMSRRVVCSHGSSLGTAVQYAGQGKVTLLCVRARARARVRASQCPPPQSPPLTLTLARARTYTSSLYSHRPGSLVVALS